MPSKQGERLGGLTMVGDERESTPGQLHQQTMPANYLPCHASCRKQQVTLNRPDCRMQGGSSSASGYTISHWQKGQPFPCFPGAGMTWVERAALVQHLLNETQRLAPDRCHATPWSMVAALPEGL